MTTYHTIDKRLSKGDTLEVPDSEAVAENTAIQNGGVRYLAVYADAPSTEQVVLTARFRHGDTIEVPDGGRILAVSEGSGMANPVAYLLVPRTAYGGSR